MLYATLMEHFHWTPDQIGNLTHRQISQLALHHRDKYGSIEEAPEPVPETKTYEEEIGLLRQLAGAFGMPDKHVQEQTAVLKKKWNRTD